MKRASARISVFICWLFIINTASAQNITVTGTVTDKLANAGLPGVSVVIKGGTTGTKTDVNGKYSLSVAPNSTLVFTYIGYATTEVAVSNQKVINVTLEGSAQSLNQVVVVGYGTQRKRDEKLHRERLGSDIEQWLKKNNALPAGTPGYF